LDRKVLDRREKKGKERDDRKEIGQVERQTNRYKKKERKGKGRDREREKRERD